jgi:hypothetical protein
VRSMPASAFDGAVPSDPRSALCVACHAPAADQALASPPGGALWQGYVRVPAVDGEGWDVVRAEGAHGQVPGGCIGCHGASAEAKLDHSFRVDRGSCTPCHEAEIAPLSVDARELQQRARVLAQTLSQACSTTDDASQPAHASARMPVCESPRQARALFEVSLVLEDPAAFIHNAALARALLQDAEAHR